jgi:hypothetical protein
MGDSVASAQSRAADSQNQKPIFLKNLRFIIIDEIWSQQMSF